VNYEKETIKWMTGKGKYKASFGEFTDVCGLDYHTMKEEEQMNKLPKVKKKSEVAQLYVTPDFEFGKIKDLTMEPSVLNMMLRYTLLPKVGNTNAIYEKYYVAIKSILDGTKVNWVDFLV
jgi:hypothetical protein